VQQVVKLHTYEDNINMVLKQNNNKTLRSNNNGYKNMKHYVNNENFYTIEHSCNEAQEKRNLP
jgi:hypothetical protein